MSTRSTSLRRSRRAPKRISDYNVGDVVEVSLECYYSHEADMLDRSTACFHMTTTVVFRSSRILTVPFLSTTPFYAIIRLIAAA
jgi:hypothetical protein